MLIQALSEYSPDEAKVLRDGRPIKIRAEMVVPGDIVILAQGDKIPADCRLLATESNSFRIDQAILTGESESVEKYVKRVSDPKAVKQDQVNMLFAVSSLGATWLMNVGHDCDRRTCQGDCHGNGHMDGNWRYSHEHCISNLRTNAIETKTRRFRGYARESH